jgi:hypothetical protein
MVHAVGTDFAIRVFREQVRPTCRPLVQGVGVARTFRVVVVFLFAIVEVNESGSRCAFGRTVLLDEVIAVPANFIAQDNSFQPV